MMRSMTGFSKSEASENGITAIVELKSLNGRHLDISCRMPRTIQHKENLIRDTIKKSISRGSIQVNINLDINAEMKKFGIDNVSAGQCFDALNELRKNLKIRETVKLEHILQFSDLFMDKDEPEDDKLLMKPVLKALSNGIRSLNNMRTREGKQISQDIISRMKRIEKKSGEIENLGAARIPEAREKLRQKIAQLFESDEIDEQRLQMEMVLMADKLDISEEVVRLRSHISYFFDIIKQKEPVGRKINFLLQELNREANTIGSKINDARISQLTVQMKEELEKIREQIQNIE